MKLKFPWQKIQMIKACIEFADLRLWEQYDNMDLFVVETPLEDPVVVSIMGAGGQEYGLSAFRGPDAFQQIHLLNDNSKTMFDKLDTIGFSMLYYKDMQHEEKKWLKSCNYRVKKSEWVPSVISKKQGQIMEMVDKDHDIKLMLYILRGIIQAKEQGDFRPGTRELTGSKMMTIEVSGDESSPDVNVTRRSFPGSKELLNLCNNDMFFDEPQSIEPFEMPDIDLSVVPADDDLQGWKDVQAVLTGKFIDFWVSEDKLRKNRPSKQFFGDTDWKYYIDEFGDMMSLPTYVVWAALTYRTRKNKPTFAEELLAGDLPEALRITLEALNNTYPSLYQIEEMDAETGKIVLRDLLLSKTISIHDQSLSEMTQLGWIVPFRVYSLGDFNFIYVAGPAFSCLNAAEIIEELQDLKLPPEPTPQWLRENAHIFGRLWMLYDDISERDLEPPNLANTDGEPLEFITAYFEYDNLKKVHKALRKRDDVDYDKDLDEYIWLCNKTTDTPMETTLLARIFFEDDEIGVEVNSKKRLDKLTTMLEAIDGVHYLDHNSRDVEDMMEEVSENKDLIKESIPEEVLDAVRDNMCKYYIDWLDEPIPFLDNKTPRQAAKSKKGAQKVKIMIETIPAPMGGSTIKIPKTEMLKELGL